MAVFSYGSKEETLYEFSRSIYRRLAPHVSGATPPQLVANRNDLLEAAEETLKRLGADPFAMRNPTRSLFRSIQPLFPLGLHREVYLVVERHISLARVYAELQARAGRGLDGERLRCASDTRKGRPCERAPLPGRKYCPSHQHLEEQSDVSTLA